MAYTFTNDPVTPLKDAISLDGPPDDLVPSGFVESRIRQLNIISSKDRPKTQNSLYVASAREGGELCSPACQGTRLEVSAAPPVGHSYPGLRINDNHSDDNGVAWEVSSMSTHMYNVKPNLRASRSTNSLGFQSPTRDASRFRGFRRSVKSASNRADDTKSNIKFSGRPQANPRVSLSTIQTARPALDNSTEEQQDALDMFDMYGVPRPEGWLSDERERQQVSQKNTVQCKTELVSGLTTNLSADHVHTQGQQKLEQEAWRQGVAHSRSLGDLSEPMNSEDRTNNRLSHSKSRDSITGHLKGSQPGYTETERQSRQQFRHERRQRLEKSYSDMINSEQYFGCPTCHASSNPARHSICCLARQSPSRRQTADRVSPSKEEATYKSSSKGSIKSTNRKNDVEMNATLATSLSSDYITAEPYLSQQLEHNDLSEDRANAVEPPSQGLHAYAPWVNNAMRTSPRRRAHDLAEDATTNTQQTLRRLHSIEQDSFWTGPEDPRTSQRTTTIPQPLRNGNQSTPKLILEGVELESMNLNDSGRTSPGKALSMTPAALRRIPPSRESSSISEPQHESKHEQTKDTEAYQPQGLPQKNRKDRNSLTRKTAGPSPKTPRRGAGETPGSGDSLEKVANAAKSPKQDIKSSDASTWKQQLKKVGDTLMSRSNSPRKAYSPLASDSQQEYRQSPNIVIHEEEAIASSSTRHETETEEQIFKVYEQVGSTNHNQDSNQEEDAVKEPNMASTAPNEDSEMPISHHICEWRSRYLGLSAAFDKLKNELDIALEHQASPDTAEQGSENASRQDQYNDYGIEGLTIIVHRRCKEDLVLNTDLREEEPVHVGE
ncbi:hypothetical protein ACHAQJ_000606 [Trichoderma viride]